MFVSVICFRFCFDVCFKVWFIIVFYNQRQGRAYWRLVKLASSGRMRLPAYTSAVPPNSWKVISVTTPKTVPAPRRPASSSGFTVFEISICKPACSLYAVPSFNIQSRERSRQQRCTTQERDSLWRRGADEMSTASKEEHKGYNQDSQDTQQKRPSVNPQPVIVQ